MSKQTPDYGLDAPAAIYAMFVLGLAGAIFGFVLVMDFEPARQPGLCSSNFWPWLSDPRGSHVRQQSLR